MINNLKHILSDMREICQELDMRPSDDMLLDCSTRIFNSPIRNKEETKVEELATEKQKDFLAKKGIKFSPDLTKKNASKLIDEVMKR